MIRVWQGWGDDWKYRGAMNWLQSKKSQGLVKDGLSPLQAREFVWYKFSNAYMRRFRNAIRRGEAGKTKESAWALWRKYHEDALRRRGLPGGYEEPERKYDSSKPHKKLTSDGKVDTQHTSEYERARRSKTKGTKGTKGRDGVAPTTPSGTKESFIAQLELQIKATPDPQRRKQLQQQIDNLRESMQ